MITLANFRIKYPEFRAASDTLVNVMLTDAALRIDPDVYLTKTDQAHGLLTAHLLMCSPFGASMAKSDEDPKKPTYLKLFTDIRREQTRGWLKVIV